MESTHKLDNEHFEILLRPDGIVQITGTDHTYTKEDIQAIHAAVNTLTGNQKSLMLLLAANFTTINSEARHFLSTPEAANHSIAEAYVIKSLAQRIILNFVIRVTGTQVPVSFFSEVGLAVEWLKSFNSNEQKHNKETANESSEV